MFVFCLCACVCNRLCIQVYVIVDACENEWVFVTLKHDNEKNGKRREKGQTPTNRNTDEDDDVRFIKPSRWQWT